MEMEMTRRVENALRLLQADPELLNLHRRRFSESPPAFESPPITEPPTPRELPAQRAAYDEDELLHQPLNDEELNLLRISFKGYSAGDRFFHEFDHEQQHIKRVYYARDEEGSSTYSGLDLEGRAGGQRCRVMIRNSIRKRWERLGIWNPAWGIPYLVNSGENDDPRFWKWEWDESGSSSAHGVPMNHAWPSAEQENARDRIVRRFVQEHKRWGEPSKIVQAESQLGSGSNIDPRELFFASRPWVQFDLDRTEECIRLKRVQIWDIEETSWVNTRNQWKHDGRWKDSWCMAPGWKWPHESPSPEPEDPNDMDFSSSELDALNAIPPPTPPKKFVPREDSQRIFFGSNPCPGSTITTRKRQEEDSTDGGASLIQNTQPKASKKGTKTDFHSRPRRSIRNQNRAFKPSKSEAGENTTAALGSLWLDASSSAFLPVTTKAANRTRTRPSGRCVKVRRSARVANLYGILY